MEWYVARTRFGQELKIRDRLKALGIEHFIPSVLKTVERRNRRQKVEKPVINNLVFLKTDKKAAFDLANLNGVPVHYIIDRNTHTIMVVPEKQMNDFIAVISESAPEERSAIDIVLKVGDRVRVNYGPMKGVEGNVLYSGSKTYIAVTLGTLVQARAEIPKNWLELV